jgi:KDO2-lipid IV(A) lauroyltransferase
MGLMRSMTLETASRFSAWLWRVLAPKLYRHKRAMTHLALAFPEKSEAECRAIAQDMWSTLGATFAESFHLDRIAREPERMTLTASDAAAKAMASHHGLVMVSLHMGNWEINALAARQQGLRLAGVYQRIKNPLVDEMIRALRVDYYPKGLFSKGHEAVKGLMRVVSEGETVVTSDLATYGPWLEGTGSRNLTTRFKGYHTFRLVSQQVDEEAGPVAEAGAPHERGEERLG